MDSECMKVYSVWVKGLHKEKLQQKIICVAMCAEQAIKMTESIAVEYGWSEVEIDQLTCLGDIDIFPWDGQKESEVEPCQQ